MSLSRARGAASSPFLHNADAYRLSPSVNSPTANLCSNCRAFHAAASALRFGQSPHAHTGLTLYYPAHKPRCTVKSERTDCISIRRLAAPLLQSLPGCLSVAVPHSKSHGYSPQHASTPFGFGGAATASPTLKSRYATPSTLHSRALRFHRASPSPRLKPSER